MLRAEWQNESSQMSIAFTNEGPSGISINVINYIKPIEFSASAVANINFNDKRSRESSIIDGRIDYSGIEKSSTSLYRDYSFIIHAKNLILKYLTINENNINVKYKATVTSLKWARDMEDFELKAQKEEIPTYLNWWLKDQTIMSIILVVGWLIPIIFAYLEWKSRHPKSI